jgi:hypothetical protein
VLKYFRAEEDPKATLPKTFIAGFLQVYEYSVLFDCWGVYPASFLLHTPC